MLTNLYCSIFSRTSIHLCGYFFVYHPGNIIYHPGKNFFSPRKFIFSGSFHPVCPVILPRFSCYKRRFVGYKFYYPNQPKIYSSDNQRFMTFPCSLLVIAIFAAVFYFFRNTRMVCTKTLSFYAETVKNNNTFA